MSKDKGAKNIKKAPKAPGTKTQSDYQAGKGSNSSMDNAAFGKKK
ncbi:MAG TPA: hypothetical protein VFE53_17880 [Mucilaginibacter sp.]|jgi:hypothetical protein|nr:hypothetical protein [Mucilaginibacter sp.]